MRLRLISDAHQGGLRLTEAVGDFLDDLRLANLTPTTLEWYTYVLRPFAEYLEEECGIALVADVTEQHIRAFLQRQASRVSARRVNHYRAGIRRFYGWLKSQALVDANPASRIPKLREERRLVQVFTEEQARALLAQPDCTTFSGLRDYVFMLTLLDTGLRLSEALGLRVEDADLTACRLRVMGKGRKERIVGFSSRLRVELRHYLRQREAALVELDAPDCPWVFPNVVTDACPPGTC